MCCVVLLQVLEFAANIVREIAVDNNLNIGLDGVRLAVTAYSTQIKQIVTFQQNFNASMTINAILTDKHLKAFTHMKEAIENASRALEQAARERSGAKQVMILFSDGKPAYSNSSSMVSRHYQRNLIQQVIDTLEGVMDSGVKVYMIGVNRAEDMILEAVERHDNGYANRSSDFSGLDAFTANIINKLEINCPSPPMDSE